MNKVHSRCYQCARIRHIVEVMHMKCLLLHRNRTLLAKAWVISRVVKPWKALWTRKYLFVILKM